MSFFVGVIFVKKDSLQTHIFLVTADGVKIDYRLSIVGGGLRVFVSILRCAHARIVFFSVNAHFEILRQFA